MRGASGEGDLWVLIGFTFPESGVRHCKKGCKVFSVLMNDHARQNHLSIMTLRHYQQQTAEIYVELHITHVDRLLWIDTLEHASFKPRSCDRVW